jgi:hypothetical protein
VRVTVLLSEEVWRAEALARARLQPTPPPPCALTPAICPSVLCCRRCHCLCCGAQKSLVTSREQKRANAFPRRKFALKA